MSAAPSTAAFFTGTPTRVGPLLPNGEPLLIDPVDNWELRRAEWLSRHREVPRAAREPAFAARLEALQDMLRPPNPPPTTSQPPPSTTSPAPRFGTATGDKGKGKEEMRAEEEMDGGEVIGSRGRGDELERAMESVLAAFRQGRPLKDPLPLPLVTSLLYASWQTDGTIPPEFLKPISPPPPSYTPISAFPLVPNHQQHPGFGTVPPPVQRVVIGGDAKEKKKNPLKGSRWRTEKEIASGSDVI